jgi:hypothetical protein
MKTLILFILTASAFVSAAESPLPVPTLTGIINIEELKLAVLQEPRSLSRPAREIILKEGEKEDRTQLLEIHPKNGTVKISIAGEESPRLIALKKQNQSAGSSVGLAMDNVALHTALQLYAELLQRTVLRPSFVPNVKLAINLATTNRQEALRVIEAALAKQAITLVLDGEKFVLVAPDSMASKLNPQSAKISNTNANNPAAQTYPKGSINWSAAPIVPVLQIYAELLGKKLDQSEQPLRLPNLEIVLKNETTLTKEEMLYAFETVVGWSGIKLVPTGEGLVKAVLIPAETSSNPTK